MYVLCVHIYNRCFLFRYRSIGWRQVRLKGFPSDFLQSARRFSGFGFNVSVKVLTGFRESSPIQERSLLNYILYMWYVSKIRLRQSWILRILLFFFSRRSAFQTNCQSCGKIARAFPSVSSRWCGKSFFTFVCRVQKRNVDNGPAPMSFQTFHRLIFADL